MAKIAATYVSVWDGDWIETNCMFDPETNRVTDIETVEISNEYNTCEKEFIVLDGGKIDFVELHKKEIGKHLESIYNMIGINKPENHDDIVDFCYEDIKETADNDWHSGDIDIAFRRFLESKS